MQQQYNVKLNIHTSRICAYAGKYLQENKVLEKLHCWYFWNKTVKMNPKTLEHLPKLRHHTCYFKSRLERIREQKPRHWHCIN